VSGFNRRQALELMIIVIFMERRPW